MEPVAQHLERGDLADKLGVDRRAVEQVQYRANVVELGEAVACAAQAF
jgi:hypothetical protein